MSGDKGNHTRNLLYLGFAAVMGIITLTVAPQTGLSLSGQRLLATLVFIVVVWATEAVPYPVSTLFLILLMTWAGVGPKVTLGDSFKNALSGFSGTVPISVVAGTAFAAVVQSSGLAERIVYVIIRLVGGAKATAARVLAAIFVTDIPLAFMVPSAMGRSALYLSIAEGLKKPFEFKRLDETMSPNPFQKAAYIAAAVVPVIMGAAFLTGAEATLLAGRLIEQGTGIPQYWAGTFVYLCIPALIMLGATWYILVRLFPSTVKGVTVEFVNQRLQELGPMSRDEKFVLVTLVVAIALWVTDKLHHVPAEAILLLAASVLFIPGIGPGNWRRDSKSIAWGAYLVIAVSSGFASMLDKNGVIKLITNWLGYAGVTSFVGVMLLMVAATVILRLGVASITGATALFIPLAISLGKASGLSPSMLVGLGWITYVFCRAGYILPQQTSQLMMAYDFNFFSRSDLVKAGVLITLATLIIYGLWASLVIPSLVG